MHSVSFIDAYTKWKGRKDDCSTLLLSKLGLPSDGTPWPKSWMLHQRRAEIVFGLCNLLSSDGAQTSVVLCNIVRNVSLWQVCSNVNGPSLISRCTMALSLSTDGDEAIKIGILGLASQLDDLDKCPDAAFTQDMLVAMLEAISANIASFSGNYHIIDALVGLAKVPCFDLQLLLGGLPGEVQVEEFVKVALQPLRTSLILVEKSIVLHESSSSVFEPVIERIYSVLLEFLMAARCPEPFLCSLFETVMRCKLILTEKRSQDGEMTLAILGSWADRFSCSENLISIIGPLGELICLSVQDRSTDQNRKILESLNILRTTVAGFLLDVVNNHNDPYLIALASKFSRSCGSILGKLLAIGYRIDESEERQTSWKTFCQSFVENLASDVVTAEETGTYLLATQISTPLFTGVLRGIQGCPLELVSLLESVCVSSLIVQAGKLERIPHGLALPALQEVFAELAEIAGVGSVNAFSDIADLLMSEICVECTVSEKVRMLLPSFTELRRVEEPLKLQYLCFLLLQRIVDLAVSIAQEPEDSDKNAKMLLLDQLLPSLARLVEKQPGQGRDRASLLRFNELFEELWLVLVLIGFLPSLGWRSLWQPAIEDLALASPLLVKERDKLQAPGSSFGRAVFDSCFNSQRFGSIWAKLLPGQSERVLRSITLAQTLWLLAIHVSSAAQYHQAKFRHLLPYLENEVVDELGLFPLVKDLLLTSLKTTMEEVASVKWPRELALLVVEQGIGHMIPRVHRASVEIFELLRLDEQHAVFADEAIWKALLQQLRRAYYSGRASVEICLLLPETGAPCLDPILARLYLPDMLSICRSIFGRAAAETPNRFFSFVAAVCKHKEANTSGDRDLALIELLRQITFFGVSYAVKDSGPARDLNDYPTADTLLRLSSRPFRNPENFMRKNLFEALAVFQCTSAILQAALSEVGNLCNELDNDTVLFRSKIDSKIDSHKKDQSPAIRIARLFDQLAERALVDSLASGANAFLFWQFCHQILSMKFPSGSPSSKFILCRTWLLLFQIVDAFKVLEANHRRLLLISALHFIKPLISSEQNFLYEHESQHFQIELVQILLDLIDRVTKEAVEFKATLGIYSLLVMYRSVLESELQDLKVWQQPDKDISPLKRTLKKPIRSVILLPIEITKELLARSPEFYAYLVYVYKNANRFLSATVPRLPVVESHRSYGKMLAGNSLLSTALILQEYTRMDIDTAALIYAAPLTLPAALISSRQQAHPLLNLVMRSFESLPGETLFFYIPQIVQSIRHDTSGYMERAILHVARVAPLFAHQIIWNMQANQFLDEAGIQPDPVLKPALDQLCGRLVQVLQNASPDGQEYRFFQREFAFFERITSISGTLKPLIKSERWEKKLKIDEELRKVQVDPGVYLPSNPESILIDIDYDSGRPLQSHAKAPFMATFKVLVHGSEKACWQSVIFKVGDDCRQDVLALQLISVFKLIFAKHHLPLYLFPYRVIATAPGCGIIEVIPDSISRDQLGREKINSLYDYFLFRFGSESGSLFQRARVNFVRSLAAYSIVCHLLAIKDRHNGNIMLDGQGHIIHIDFGFILDIAPGGITFENAPFKLTFEMLQVMGVSSAAAVASIYEEDDALETSAETVHFRWFRELCVQAFLAARVHAEPILHLVEAMGESGLPCFRDDNGATALRKLRGRFRLDLLDVAQVRQHVYDLIYRSCENVRTTMYDRYQLRTNGIPY